MSEPKIQGFKNDDFKQLEVNLHRWSKFLGISEPIDEQNAMMLVTFLSDYYQDFSMKEITNAIMMGLNGDLDVNMTHYNSFSSVYLSSILNAYRTFRQKAYFTYKNLCHDKMDELNKPTEEQKWQLIAQATRETLQIQVKRFEECKGEWGDEEENEFANKGIGLMCDYLIFNGYIKPLPSGKEKGEADLEEKMSYMASVFAYAKEKGINFPDLIHNKIRNTYEQIKSNRDNKKPKSDN